MKHGFAIVVDIGKTLSKITLWSRDGRMLEKHTRANEQPAQDGILRLDEAGIAAFVRETLARFAGHPVEYIVPVAHGASIVAIADDALVCAPIDYEQEPPQDIALGYRRQRAPFAQTGSPALPACLNCGIQVYWMEQLHPALIQSAMFMPWAQYWAWFLTGEASTEVTSLGCHSDLWNPAAGEFSQLAVTQGWADRFAPLRGAHDVVGTLHPELAAKTGLPNSAKVLAGLHDSNAALMAARGFPAINRGDATILSTGTWFIAMRLAESPVQIATLPEERDCLVNVDPFGRPVPSARFMGGREIESLIQIDTRRVDIKPDQPRLLAAVPEVLANCAMVLPTLAPGNGPFPHKRGGWINEPSGWYARRAGACLYAALVADTALDLVGARETLLIEGRFAEAEVFVRALASLRPTMEVFVANAHNDVSFGASRLLDPNLSASGELRRIEPLPQDLSQYVRNWHERVECPQ